MFAFYRCSCRLFSVATVAGLATLLSHAWAATVEESATRPWNIILIVVDDLGWRDLSCQGSPFYRTPEIDRLAGEGMRFTNAYAACAVCSPTRAAIMTGRYPARVGVTDWIRARFNRGGIGTPPQNPTEYVGQAKQKLLCPPNPYWMELDELTIAEALQSAGYVSCHIGKWHLGDDAWYPQHQGFALNFGGCDYGQPPSYFDPFTNSRLPQGIPSLPGRRPGQYLTERESEEATAFIKSHRDRPFFLYLAHYCVHTPIQAKPDVARQYYDLRQHGLKNPDYAAMIQSVDDSLRTVRQTLDDERLSDRTLIIFTSDNGGLDRDGDPTDNAPLRSGKGYAYDGGIRVPLIVKMPGEVEAGSLSHQPVCSIDFFPTLMEIAGLPLPDGRAVDGLSLLGHLRSAGTAPLNRDSLYWHFPHYRHPPGPYSIIRRGDLKLIKYYEGPQFELYDLANDLGETNNLSDERSEDVRSMHEQLNQHLAAVGAKLPRANPNYRLADSP